MAPGSQGQASDMFAIVVAGRLVQTEYERVGDNQFLFNIPNAEQVNHIVVFMTGSVPFPLGTAGLVYFSWPTPDAPQSWLLLGHISNSKPSVIYKISNVKKVSCSEHPFVQQQQSHVAQIGISVEPESNASMQTATLSATPSNVDSFVEFATKMLENFCNFVTSFAVTQAQMQANPAESYVPLGNVNSWYDNFRRRMQQNPFFWRN